MGEIEQRYHNILVGIDGSKQAMYAFDLAIDVAKRNNGQIFAAVVIQNNMYDFLGYGNISEDLLKRAQKDYQVLLDSILKRAHDANFENVQTKIVYGNPKEILSRDLPKEYSIDLIMVGQSGLNRIERFMVGSVSQYIIAHAPCDVLIVNPESREGNS